MKSKFLILLAALALPVFGVAQKVVKESCKPATPPVIDGDVSDWPVEWMLDPKGKFIYNICNDDKNLYIRIKVSDDITQRKIGLFGFSVFLNSKGPKVGKIGLRYPVEKDMAELNKKMPAGGTTPDAATMAKMKRELVQDEQLLEFVGFQKKPIPSTRLGLMNGLEVIIVADAGGDYIYEAKFPFKAFHIDKSAVKVLGVAFVTGKMPPPKTQATTPPPGGGYGGRGYNPYNRGYGNPNYGQRAFSAPRYNEFNASTFMSVGVKLQ